jgi:hypothetical protein
MLEWTACVAYWRFDMTLHTHGRSLLLRRALIADAVISGVTGLIMVIGADLLGSVFAVPAALLRYVGISLLPFAAFLVVLATREHVSRGAVRAVIIANALWVIDSFLLLLTGWVEPSMLGYAFIIGQAIIVALFAEIQHVGLKNAAAGTV